MPREIRIISVATAIRWVGWGMAEPLFPVFLFSLLKSYGSSGLVSSAGEIVFLLILPVAGILADRIPLKTFLVIGLCVFFLDGFWTIAAITGVALFALLANLLDGIAVASDVVGRATYIRRYAPIEKVASVMGYQNSLIYLGTVVGCCISLILVPFTGYAWIFFGIIPTNIIALLLVLRFLPKDHVVHRDTKEHYWSVWKDVLKWPKELHYLAILTLLFYALTALATLLIPIYAYVHGANFPEVIILGIIAVLPQLFSSPLGKIADTWRDRLLPIGLIFLAFFIGLLTFVTLFSLLLPIILVIEVILVLLCLVVENLVTAISDPSHYGRTSAVFEGLKDMGKFIGAVGFGFALDLFGSHQTFFVLAGGIFVIAFLTIRTVRDKNEKTHD